MRTHVLERAQVLDAPLADVFDFFSDAWNLQRLTPPFLHFQILSGRDAAIEEGTRIDYRIRLYGFPMRWRTVIERFEPERLFVDVQLSGPYRLWRHLHTFAEVPGGTEVRDRVEYALPLGPIGDVAHALFVRRSLREIFDYRQRVMAEIFPPRS